MMSAYVLLIGTLILSFTNGFDIFKPNATLIFNDTFFKPHAYSEGPMFDRKGNLYMTAPHVSPQGVTGCDIYSVDLKRRKLSSIAQPNIKSVGGNSNGGQCDRDGNLWVTDLRHALLKVTPDGKYTQIARKDSNNQPLQGFNDGTFDFTGNMWMTAPVGEIAPAKYRDNLSPQTRVNGSLYCYNRTRGDIIKLDTGNRYVNGIAVHHSKDGKPVLVLVSETFTRKVWAYDIIGPCQVRNKRVWGTSPETGVYYGGYDGMKFDAIGNVLVTHFSKGTIEVFSQKGGKPDTIIRLPPGLQNLTNIAFKPNSNEVVVTTEPATLWSFKWKHKGRVEYEQLTTNGSTKMVAFVTILLVTLLHFI